MNRFLLIVSVLVGLAVGGFTVAQHSPVAALSNPMSPAFQYDWLPNYVEPHETSAVDELSSAFARVADVIKPSVVSVSVAKKARAARRLPTPFHGHPLSDLFGYQFFFGHPPPAGDDERDLIERGTGTGFVVDRAGHVITNYHVVRDADEVTIALPDGERCTAEVVGVDPKTDLAVLKVEGDYDLAPAKLGNSTSLRVGHWVVAAGNPFGLSSTITAGIVSAVGRTQLGVADYEDFIQTDAAINPGNSGGPLVNLRGEVVGVNTAIFTKSGGYMGVGLAIPIDLAKTVTDSLIENGRVIRGWLGTHIQDLSRGLAGSFGFDGTDGVLISEVVEDSPAKAAGLERGDIITRYGERPIEDVATLRLRVAQTTPGTAVPLELYRDGKKRVLEVEIGELPEEHVTPLVRDSDHELGLSVETLSSRMGKSLGLDASVAGVVVTRVEPFGAAATAGLRLRDVIVAVDDEPVRTAEAFDRAIADCDPSEGVRLDVVRGSSRMFVFLEAGD